MDFAYLEKILSNHDEIMVIGTTVVMEGKPYHFIGMSRHDQQAELYILSIEELWENHSSPERERKRTMRSQMREMSGHNDNNLYHICRIRIGGLELEAERSEAGRLEDGGSGEQELLLLAEFMRAGWKLPEEDIFRSASFREILLTRIAFATGIEALPDWRKGGILVECHADHQECLVEKPVTLTVGREKKITFPMQDGKTAVCYIQKVYPIDVWKVQEEKFKAAGNLEHMPEEEVHRIKRLFEETIEPICPKGTCYLGIEYECTEDVALDFYSKEYLSSRPSVHSGSVSFFMVRLKPEETTGTHGLKLKGCIIQKPVSQEIEELKAELFRYRVTLPGKLLTVVSHETS